LVHSGVTHKVPISPSGTDLPVSGSTTSMKYMSVQMWMPSWAALSAPMRPASLMPNTSNTSAPQKRPSFSRLAADSVSAEQTSFLTEEAARSIPFASARLARCSAKLLMPMNTVGRNVWIKSSCAAEG